MLTTKKTNLSALGIITFRFRGQYLFHFTYHKGRIMDIICNTLDVFKAGLTASGILLGVICWFFFSLVLIGCSTPTESPEESGYSQDFCYMNDSIYKIEGKRYKVGKTERATIWIDSSGNLWRHGKDGKIIPVDYSDTERCGG